MKTPKQSTPPSPGSKTPEKSGSKLAKTPSPRKSPARRTPIKLRATTEKCVAKRTRDKSPKLSKTKASPNKASVSGVEKVKTNGSKSPTNGNTCKSPTSGKSKTVAKKVTDAVAKGMKKKALEKRSGVTKAKTMKGGKGSVKMKSKVSKPYSPESFIDLWAIANIGKREASLNASMKVNIMYESQSASKSPKSSPKKSQNEESKQDTNSKSKGKTSSKVKTDGTSSDLSKQSKGKSTESSKEKSSPKGKGCASPEKSKQIPKKSPEKNGSKKSITKSKHTDVASRKRKSPGYKIFKEEPPAKCRKVDSKKVNSKLVKKKNKKSVPAGHQLSNIIEKSPRQASLIAKAMIAMEQEEETVNELSSRTRIYDLMELRPFCQSDSRRIRWVSGFGNSSKSKIIQSEDSDKEDDKHDGASTAEVDVSGQNDNDTVAVDNESLHNTLLRTLHKIGDSRLLKEYLRAQKEDFKGSIDVEICTSPEKLKIASPELKKVMSPPAVDEKPEKVFEKTASCSPAKPQPCRVATPIPQFPVGQRTSHMTSYIHHPIAQPMYPQQHAHTHPQPIKVTPYTPSQTYIYPYTMDRPQSGLYATASPSPLPYGVGNNEITPRDYSSTFTISHMGSLSLGRRGVNPYQPTAYNPSLHLPMQQIGFNFPAYYQASLQTLPQQNMSSIQSLPLHQQYPLVQPPVITQHQIPQDMSQLGTYQHSYSQFPQLSSMGQESGCMPPPPPPAHSHRPTPMGPPPPPSMRPPPMSHQSMPAVSPIESLRSMNPVGVQPIVRSPALDFHPITEHNQATPHKQTSAFPAHSRPQTHPQKDHILKGKSASPVKYTIAVGRLNSSFSPCKKEQEDIPSYSCDSMNKNSSCSSEGQHKSPGSSRTAPEGSDVSDLLHSAHTTMYQIDGVNSVENITGFHQAQASVSCNSTVGNTTSPSKISIIGHASFNASYSVSSILDMPSHKMKSEPHHKTCAISLSSTLSNGVDKKLIEQHNDKSTFVCFASVGSNDGSDPKDSDSPPNKSKPQKSESSGQNRSISQESQSEGKSSGACHDNVIVIEDTDESSDDEPLAKLVKSKGASDTDSQHEESHSTQKGSKSKILIPNISLLKTSVTNTKEGEKVKSEVVNKTKTFPKKAIQTEASKPSKQSTSESDSSCKKTTSAKSSAKRVVLKPHHENTSGESQKSAKDDVNKTQGEKDSSKGKGISKKVPGSGNPKVKKSSKKVKAKLPQTPPKLNANHGWTWMGEGQMKPVPKLTLGREEPVRIRKCYQSMKHSLGEVISVRDCVILQSDGDGSIPYVAKVSALWENLHGDMMFSMLWYYQPEHTATGREPEDGEQELFASKHREENSVACIDDKCYVLMYNEYCRLEAEGVRQEQGVPLPRWREQIPGVSEEEKHLCRPQPPATTCVDNIWFCRYDYDIRKKIVRKPKHKKSNLRYRVPNKLA